MTRADPVLGDDFAMPVDLIVFGRVLEGASANRSHEYNMNKTVSTLLFYSHQMRTVRVPVGLVFGAHCERLIANLTTSRILNATDD